MSDAPPRACRLGRTLGTQVALGAMGAAGLGAASVTVWLVPSTPPSSAEGLRWAFSSLAAAGALGLAWASGHLAARHWRDLGKALRERDGESDALVAPFGPAEVRVSIETLNAWIGRRREAVGRQHRLLGDASHQLRTPLAVLRTLLQGTPAEELGARQGELLRTVDRATAVVEEMLARLKLDQRRAQTLAATSQRLDAAAKEAAIEFAPLIGTRGLQFELEAVPLAVRADAWMLGELVRNLLANAIRHSPEKGRLGIVVRLAHDGPELIVWDSGPGLGNSPRERLFEPFAAASGGGIGLGLSICRELARSMGARVELFNRTDGHSVMGVDAIVRWPTAADFSTPPVNPPHEGDSR